MAQPNVAREPSMEEILASIRRIIESNEPHAENPLQHPLPPVYAEDEIDDDDIGIVAELAANDPGQPYPEPSRQSETHQFFGEPQPERSLSLADVAARVRAAADRPPELRFEPRVEPRMEARSEPVAAPASMASAPAVRPVARQPEPEHGYREPQHSAPAPAPQQARVSEVPKAPEPAQVEAPMMVEPAEPKALPAKIEATAMLMSEEAGAQVARSFGELAAAFDGVQNRSLEDLAQEMLRPMLQDWLDDNLPTLVERLVREEIERVARGPRR
ncbi:DUF2497 domain-containing protein [Rhizobium halophilum]|uniref:DUF2497 domain-containing protein n=1 Tax=Rhizobium halophilum TaxID=2846852 RepID=UPI001EFED38B|nr:DUF2497 domain-containing protein [Rhizobium halophilum]MCF6370710.1 DUF2497 domain-containing protein [Rhizobium halophilum]